MPVFHIFCPILVGSGKSEDFDLSLFEALCSGSPFRVVETSSVHKVESRTIGVFLVYAVAPWWFIFGVGFDPALNQSRWRFFVRR